MRIFSIGLLFLFAAAIPVSAETITVSAAISLKESLGEIGKAYEAATGEHIAFNFDASGKLAAQIQQGAPVDAFISADDEQMDKLKSAGKIVADTRRLIVQNTLVLIAPADEKNPPRSFTDLSSGGDRKIAIGEPKSVPAGRYAMQTLKALKLDQAVKPHLVMGESVRQVLTYVIHDQVWAGIVYGTDAEQAGDKVKVIATADAATHDKIEYPAAVISASSHQTAAGQFLDYLHSASAEGVLTAHGFSIPAIISTTRPSP